MRWSTIAAAAVLAGLATACGGNPPTSKPPTTDVRSSPDLAAFLREPVATPSVCPSNVSGSTVGRRSPWVGHVDFSVFLAADAPVQRIRQQMLRSHRVQTIYYESSAEAYQEFARLYTCWAEVPKSQTPASLRVVLLPTATIAERNDLVAQVLRLPGVETVSCDPALPCTTIVESAQPSS